MSAVDLLSEYDGVTEERLRNAVVEAIEHLRANDSDFHRASVSWDLVYDGERFPPKLVAETALERLGHTWGRKAGPQTNDLLTHLGFEIEPRTGNAASSGTPMCVNRDPRSADPTLCSKLADAVRQGLPQQYAERDDDLPALRGRLDVTRQFSTLAVSPQKLARRFDERSSDVALNQVMRATIGKLSRLAQAPDNQRTLRELSFAYADIAEIPPGALRWDLTVLDRTSTRWRELVALVRLFLCDRHQQTSAGASDGYALLFEMNVLFEEYVARLLGRALSGTDLRVTAQGATRTVFLTGRRDVSEHVPT